MLRPGWSVTEGWLGSSDLDSAAQLAQRAFFDDVFFRFLVPSDAMRVRSLRIVHRTVFAHLGPGGRVVCVRDERGAILGLTAWLAPGSYPLAPRLQLAQVPGSLRAFYRRPRSIIDGGAYQKAVNRAHPTEPHWYLWVAAVDPAYQRRGIGTVMMERVLADADEQHLASHLETQKDENVAYYRRYGYELRDTLSPVAGGPNLYSMWRAAR